MTSDQGRVECGAKGCGILVPGRFFFCSRHWRMVPKEIREDIINEFRPGHPLQNAAYHDAYLAAMRIVARKEATKP